MKHALASELFVYLAAGHGDWVEEIVVSKVEIENPKEMDTRRKVSRTPPPSRT